MHAPPTSAVHGPACLFVPSQAPTTRVLKETLFSRGKCTVRVTQCLPDIASFLARIMLSLFMSIPFCPPSLAARADHAVLLREYVSRKSAGKGRAVLEGVGLDAETIAMFYANNPLNEEEAVHCGLLEWANGKARSH